MSRILSIAGCIAVLLAGSLNAQPPGNRAEEFPLPLEKVVLFTSGVGYFQHGGKVNNDAQVEMSFKSEHINDLLKSMVLEDLGGGTVSTVSYASRDPLTKTLETFAVNLTDNPSMGQLLGRLRGEAIDVDALAPASGTIVGVEKRAVPVGADKTIEKEFVTILTKDGLRTLPLDSITRIKLVDPRLQSELEKALAVLALGHDNEKKSVTLNFSGKGARDVRVGYVQQTPIWKTSYRLVLDDAAGGNQAMLQGFAIVENTTDNDWKDVSMSLVSGRPISFVMDLYQPLYVPRPEVQQELYASLVPQVYGQDLAGGEREFLEAASRSRITADNPLVANKLRKSQLAANQLAAAPAGSFAKNDSQDQLQDNDNKGWHDKSMFEAAASVQSMAQGGALGELFRYEIAKPVTIQRQRSAMLPIVGEKVEAEKVAIYDERVMAKHPLAGLRLVNSTKLNLMQGPITVYDGGAYAGDARVEDMAPGSERLLSYAVDLDVEIAPRAVVKPEEIVSMRVEKGTLIASRKLAREKKFDVKNSGDKGVKVLVEYPLESGWKLVKPAKADEVTRDRQRFVVIAQPGKPAVLDVAEEMLVDQRIVITNLDDNAILFYSNAKVTSPDVKKALAEIIRRKREIEQVVREKAASQQEIATVSQEQDRIRQNMQQLDRGSELYTRYVQKFAQQEDRVETLRKEVAQREKQEQEARRALDDFLSQL
ncbi:MAG: DUF4139 domain-containing protein [Planctomycetota bacterium]|nr:MAG: DUF4139 domain-containing protein [Planctomycetota bacterium]